MHSYLYFRLQCIGTWCQSSCIRTWTWHLSRQLVLETCILKTYPVNSVGAIWPHWYLLLADINYLSQRDGRGLGRCRVFGSDRLLRRWIGALLRLTNEIIFRDERHDNGDCGDNYRPVRRHRWSRRSSEVNIERRTIGCHQLRKFPTDDVIDKRGRRVNE